MAVAVTGLLLAVFVPVFLREVRTSKVSEASNVLAELHRRAAAYYAARHDYPGASTPHTRCLPPAAGPTPEMPSEDPVEVDFTSESVPGHETWAALDFSPDRPLRYRYTFLPVKEGCNLESENGRPILTLRAEGDLDGDGKLSLFERRSVTTAEGALVPHGVLRIQNRIE